MASVIKFVWEMLCISPKRFSTDTETLKALRSPAEVPYPPILLDYFMQNSLKSHKIKIPPHFPSFQRHHRIGAWPRTRRPVGQRVGRTVRKLGGRAQAASF